MCSLQSRTGRGGQADLIGIPMLYMFGALCMVLMVAAMYLYVEKFGAEMARQELAESSKSKDKEDGKSRAVEECHTHCTPLPPPLPPPALL
jgi:hypothetical protein